jgi:chromosome segregation ATPase
MAQFRDNTATSMREIISELVHHHEQECNSLSTVLESNNNFQNELLPMKLKQLESMLKTLDEEHSNLEKEKSLTDNVTSQKELCNQATTSLRVAIEELRQIVDQERNHRSEYESHNDANYEVELATRHNHCNTLSVDNNELNHHLDSLSHAKIEKQNRLDYLKVCFSYQLVCNNTEDSMKDLFTM